MKCERCGAKYQYIGDGLFHEYCLRFDCKEEEESPCTCHGNVECAYCTGVEEE